MKPSTSTERARRLFVTGSVAGTVAALTGWLRLASAESPPPAAADGRPAIKGRAPVIFVGHGSPMNVINDNAFTRRLRTWGFELGQPRAIGVVSAHWLTTGDMQVSTTDRPATIHDFGGFPAVLHARRYPAPGAPAAAQRAMGLMSPRRVVAESVRGLDHGAWSILTHLYPAADVPVFQVSIAIDRPGVYQHSVGRALAALRDEGVLIIGSGNVVHNLRATMPGQADSEHGLQPWAEEFDQRVKAALEAGDWRALADHEHLSAAALQAVPYPDHYDPLLSAVGAAQSDEKAKMIFEGFQAGTLSMRCVQWG
jgi:4,5-DOPA dioxygenase extradiol